ncbi:MAG: hypothetical protein Q8R67_15160 [Rhodoferax sp.]|nr:hypothetical protein [Rhodoferax sp.]MDP3653013.1 hypothetical protein [Rhodoferax sp.]
MKRTHTFAALLIAVYAVSTGAWGQKVYRCGASYSQTPCPGAVTVEADDARSPQQKAQADRAIARDVAAANTLDKARLKEEAQAAAPTIPNTKSSKTKTAKSKTRAKTKKVPEFFTAKAAAEKEKKKN